MYIAKTDKWYLERVIWLLAGIFSLASISLGFLIHPNWFLLAALVGINQMILSLTGFCPMTVFLNRVGIKSRIQ